MHKYIVQNNNLVSVPGLMAQQTKPNYCLLQKVLKIASRTDSVEFLIQLMVRLRTCVTDFSQIWTRATKLSEKDIP